MTRISTWRVTPLFCLMAFVHVAATAHAQVPDPELPPPAQATAALVSIEVASGRSGSGVVVSDSGLIATSFSVAVSGKKARIKYVDGTETDVLGYVAARRGKDLVLLRPKKPPLGLAPIKFFDGLQNPGTLVILHGGPRTAPINVLRARLLAVRGGDEVVAGFKRPLPIVGTDLDTCWLTVDGYLPDTGVGGAVLTSDGRLSALLVGTPTHTDRINCGVHARHVAQLLKSAGTTPKALITLKNFEDASPNDIPDSIPQALVTSGVDDRSKSIEEWFAGLVLRIQTAEVEVAECRPREDALRVTAKAQVATERELSQQLQKALDTAANVKPEMPRVVIREAIIESTSPDGRITQRRETRRVTDYFYSPRQQEFLANLERQANEIRSGIGRTQAALQQTEFRIQQSGEDLEAAKRRVTSLWNEMFFVSDPLEIAGRLDAEKALKALPNVTDSLGTTAQSLLVKALLHLRLRQFDQCEAAMTQAKDLDRSLDAIASVVRARAALLGGKKEASALLAKFPKKPPDDPRILVLMSRIDLDQGEFAAALRHLKTAREWGGDGVEIGIAQALLTSTTMQKATETAKALDAAGEACEATLWRNWRALLALSAAQARNKDFAAASKMLDRASTLAPADQEENFTRWKANLAHSETLNFTWK
jgi:tetratricopeptide (TPR) repeat protein